METFKTSDIFYMNIRSLRCHHDQLITTFDDFEVKPVLICLCETWLTENDPIDLYWLDDYSEIETSNRLNKLGGGLAFYAREDVNYTTTKCKSNIEHVIVTIHRDALGPLNVCLIYRPPDAKAVFFDEMDCLLTDLFEMKGDSILVGDFNIDVLDNLDYKTKKLEICLEAFGLSVQNEEPTRETLSTSKCIDLCISTKEIKVETLKYKISDHYALRFPILYDTNHCNDNDVIQFRDFSGFSKEDHHLKFLFYIDQALRKCQCDTVESKLEYLTGVLNSASEKYAPHKTFDATKKRSNWVTNHIKSLIHKRDKAHASYVKEASKKNELVYKKLRNSVTSEIRKAKRSYYDKKIKNVCNSKELFNCFNHFCGKETKKQREVDVEKFNDFFVSIGKKLANECSESLPNVDFDADGPVQTFALFETDASEVYSIIKHLKNKISSGHDGISNKLLRLAASSISQFLANIFNECINDSKFPKSMKIAKVLPLLKKGDFSLPDNYRPISLLTSLSKIFEKLIHKRITKFLAKHKLLTPKQFGFRENFSCAHAIAEITEFMRKTIDKKHYGLAAFIDLKKAFDTVDHNLLIKKLNSFGLRGQIENLLRDYLSDREQFVFSGNQKSSSRSIDCGVPQGSILGPLLFLIYINDLPESCKNSSMVLFADDTAIVTSKSCRNVTKDVELDLKSMNQWFSVNKMTVNVSKCTILPFGKTITATEIDELEGLAGEIDIVDKLKYLGVSIDKRLNFHSHIASIQKRLAKFNGLVYKARYCFSRKALLRFYQAYAKPIILYGLLIYGGTRHSVLNEILLMQKRIIRTIFFRKRSDTVSDLFMKHKIETVFELYVEEIFKETLFQIYGFSTIRSLDLQNQAFLRTTRSQIAGLIRPHFSRTVTAKNSLAGRVTKCYNFLMKNDLLPSFGNNIDKIMLKKVHNEFQRTVHP